MRSTLTQHLHPQGGPPPPEHPPRGQNCLLSLFPLPFVYVLLLQCQGNLPGCGQLCHIQNRCAPSVSDQLCLLANCLLALFNHSPNNSHHLVPQMISPVAFTVGHSPPLPLAIVLDLCTAGLCMFPMPSRALASSEQLYCCSTHPLVMLPNRSATHLLCKYEFRHSAELGRVSPSEDLPP